MPGLFLLFFHLLLCVSAMKDIKEQKLRWLYNELKDEKCSVSGPSRASACLVGSHTEEQNEHTLTFVCDMYCSVQHLRLEMKPCFCRSCLNFWKIYSTSPVVLMLIALEKKKHINTHTLADAMIKSRPQDRLGTPVCPSLSSPAPLF